MAAAVIVVWRSLLTPHLPPSVTGLQPTHVRIVWTEEPSTAATILWTTGAPGQTHAVWIDTEPRGGERGRYRRTFEDVRSRPLPDPDGSGLVAFVHAARTVGLAPGTKHWFVVQSDDRTSPELHFVTAPGDSRPFAILAGGDCLDRRGPRQRMNRRIAALAAADPEVLALAHGGDFVRHGDSLQEWLEWLEDHLETTTADGRVIPIVPARGNHETAGPMFDAVFDSPGGADRNWYSTRLSPEAVLITLSTERPQQGDQLTFLRRALTDAADARFRLAQYHAELWPAVRPARPSVHAWARVFDELDLELAIECNGHCVKRTVPIRDGAQAEDGVVYIGEGGLGAKQRTPQPHWWVQPPGFATTGNHVWKLRFAGGTLALEAFLEDGSVLDHIELRPRADRRGG